MKKIMLVLLALAVFISLGCGNGTTATGETAIDFLLGEWETVETEPDDGLKDTAWRWQYSTFYFYPNSAGRVETWRSFYGHSEVVRFTVSLNSITIYDSTNEAWNAEYDPATGRINVRTDDGTVYALRRPGSEPENVIETPEPVEWFDCSDELQGSWEISSIEGGKPDAVRALEESDPVFFFYRNYTCRISPRTTVYMSDQVFSFYTQGRSYDFSISDEYRHDTNGSYDPDTDTVRMEYHDVTFTLRRVRSDILETEPYPGAMITDPHTMAVDPFMSEAAVDSVAITVLIPAKATLRLVLPYYGDYIRTNGYEVDLPLRISLPVACFFPDVPHTTEEYFYTPLVRITLLDGTEYEIEGETQSYYFPTLSLIHI